MIDLTGKIALISGASRGQGEAEARLFATLGATVVLTDILDERGTEVASSIGDAATYRTLDVSDEASWQRLVADIERDFGRLDILINNAGLVHYRPIVEFESDLFRKEVEVMQFGPFYGMKHCAPLMAHGGGGSIVNIASINAVNYTFSWTSAYTGAKAALIGMSRVAAMEFGPMNIRVNVVSPGGIRTDIERPGGASSEKEHDLPVFDRIPIPRMGEPMEVAQMVAFLASDASSYCTGAEFVIDGGWTIGDTSLADEARRLTAPKDG